MTRAAGNVRGGGLHCSGSGVLSGLARRTPAAGFQRSPPLAGWLARCVMTARSQPPGDRPVADAFLTGSRAGRSKAEPLREKASQEVAPGAGPSPALPPQHAVLDRMQRKGEQVQRGEQVGQALAAVPEVALEVVAVACQAVDPHRLPPRCLIQLVKNVFV